MTHEDGRRVIVVGLGKRDELDAEKARVAAAAVAGAGEGARRQVAVLGRARRARRRRALVEGTLLAALQVRPLQVRGRRRRRRRARVARDRRRRDADEAVERGPRDAPRPPNRARDLQNLPANVATPEFLAERAAEIADEHESLEVELLDRDAIVARGMGAFAAVAQGTYTEPRLIVLRYDGGGDRARTSASWARP